MGHFESGKVIARLSAVGGVRWPLMWTSSVIWCPLVVPWPASQTNSLYWDWPWRIWKLCKVCMLLGDVNTNCKLLCGVIGDRQAIKVSLIQGHSSLNCHLVNMVELVKSCCPLRNVECQFYDFLLLMHVLVTFTGVLKQSMVYCNIKFAVWLLCF